MAQQFSKTDQKRITFLSLLSSAASFSEDPYTQATDWLSAMEADGFFESNPTPQRSERSARPASSSRPSNSGRGRDNSRPYSGGMRDPDGPPTDKQVALLLKLTDEYSEDDAWEMTKKEVSDLIEDLNS